MPKATRKVEEAARRVVLERDQNTCQRCGVNVLYRLASVQHRIARGRGGTASPRVWTPSNMVLMCGSAITPGSCHNLVENEEREQGKDEGWVLPMNNPDIYPALEPLSTYRGWILLDDFGGWEYCTPPGQVSV
jgi:5-methylcytosine-specific restriction protein A